MSHRRRTEVSSVLSGPRGVQVTSAPRVVVGRVVAGGTPLAPLVDFAGSEVGPVVARTTIAIDRATLDHAIATGQGALLLLENGDPRLPILTGLIQTDRQPSPFEALLTAPRPVPTETNPGPNRPVAASSGPTVEFFAGARQTEARVDGERVVLEGAREVVLKCGEASITLRRNGKVVVRGVYVETHAKGVNRIKGGAVKIN